MGSKESNYHRAVAYLRFQIQHSCVPDGEAKTWRDEVSDFKCSPSIMMCSQI